MLPRFPNAPSLHGGQYIVVCVSRFHARGRPPRPRPRHPRNDTFRTQLAVFLSEGRHDGRKGAAGTGFGADAAGKNRQTYRPVEQFLHRGDNFR